MVIGAVMGLIGLRGALAFAETGEAQIRGTSDDSTVSGYVRFTETPAGLEFVAQLEGAPAGKHGIHIHQFGSCGGAGKAAGNHFNPDGVQHGAVERDGLTLSHPGDFGNIEAGPDGRGSLSGFAPGVALVRGTYAVAGRAVVLHEQADDFSQPAGNAGERIGCGPIVITGDDAPPAPAAEAPAQAPANKKGAR